MSVIFLLLASLAIPRIGEAITSTGGVSFYENKEPPMSKLPSKEGIPKTLANKLPQTGREKSEVWLIRSGILVLFLSGILFLEKRKYAK